MTTKKSNIFILGLLFIGSIYVSVQMFGYFFDRSVKDRNALDYLTKNDERFENPSIHSFERIDEDDEIYRYRVEIDTEAKGADERNIYLYMVDRTDFWNISYDLLPYTGE